MSRRGFTLVELLIVAAIFAIVFGMVLTGARPNPNGQVKQAAQSIASVLLATQSKAMGNPAGGAVILEPVASGEPAVTSVSGADMLPFITGTTGLTVVSSATATVNVIPDNAATADLTDGYKIQFLDRSPAQPPSAWFSYSAGTVGLRTGNGQTTGNTIWPVPVGGGTFDVRIARYPAEAETLYDLPRGVAIDLRYSGVGDDPTTTSGSLVNDGAIAVAFDSVGAVDALMWKVLSAASRNASDQPIRPASPVYLLVALRTDVDAGTALASSTSVWVAIHPKTGRVSVSSNVAQSGTNAAALRAARASARALLTVGK